MGDRLSYIAATADSISARLEGKDEALAEDVAWIARALRDIATLLSERFSDVRL